MADERKRNYSIEEILRIETSRDDRSQEEWDLHWLSGWGKRIAATVEDDHTPGSLDWMFFRPDTQARDAMIRFGITFPQPIAQVREFLDHAEERFERLCEMLPPIGCPLCESQDYEDDGQVRHCWKCGGDSRLQLVEESRIEGARASVFEAYDCLSHVIQVASEAIGSSVVTPKQDGPFAPDGFRWQGQEYRGLQPMAWRLLSFLWSQPGKSAPFADLAEPVWQDHETLVDSSVFGGTRKRANNWLKDNEIPFIVHSPRNSNTAILKQT